MDQVYLILAFAHILIIDTINSTGIYSVPGMNYAVLCDLRVLLFSGPWTGDSESIIPKVKPDFQDNRRDRKVTPEIKLISVTEK